MASPDKPSARVQPKLRVSGFVLAARLPFCSSRNSRASWYVMLFAWSFSPFGSQLHDHVGTSNAVVRREADRKRALRNSGVMYSD